jgi:hypothetical protein
MRTILAAAALAASMSVASAADYRRGPPPPITDYGYVGPSAPGAYDPWGYYVPYQDSPCRILSGPVFDAYGNPAGVKTWETCAR